MTDSSSPTGKTRLLIVDDEPSIVHLLATLLGTDLYDITTAFSGEEALVYLKEEPIDVLITDIRMDGMDGFELIKHTRLLDPYVNVIVITGHDCYDMIRNALSLGAYDYLDKPLENHETIVSSVRRASLATRLERDNASLLEQISASHAMLEDANRRLRELNEELMVQANTDSLTQLYNRRHIDSAIEYEVARRNRYPDPLSLVMLDVDNFKRFNDEHGHEGGDLALKAIARLLNACARNTDVVGRYGGEEFIVILPKTSPENAINFAERVRESLEKSCVSMGDISAFITASLGVAGVAEDDAAVTTHGLIGAADKALYEAKNAGRNQVKWEPVDTNGRDEIFKKTG